MEVSPAAVAILEKFLKDQKLKSFSERHPELGKMINCHVCGHRHRENAPEGIVCKDGPKYARRWGLDNDNQKVYYAEELIAGQTPETETVIENRKYRAIFGAPRPKNFSMPRWHPHSNRWRRTINGAGTESENTSEAASTGVADSNREYSAENNPVASAGSEGLS